MTVAATAQVQTGSGTAPPRARMGSPARLWIMLLAGVLALLLAGSVAAVGLSGRESTARHTAQDTEALYTDVQDLSYDLADANATAATALLIGPVTPKAFTDRFNADVAAAEQRLSEASQRVTGDAKASAELKALAQQVPQFTQEVGEALADNRFGYPVAGAYLRQASTLLTGTMVPEVQAVIGLEQTATENGMSSASSPDWLTIAVCVLAFLALVVVGRMLARASKRRVNPGVLGAMLAVLVLLGWTAVAAIASSGAVDSARTDFAQVAAAKGGNSQLALAESWVALQQIDRGEDNNLDQQNAGTALKALTKVGNTAFDDPRPLTVSGDVKTLVSCANNAIGQAVEGQYEQAIASTVGSGSDIGKGGCEADATDVFNGLKTVSTDGQTRYDADMSSAQSSYAGGGALAVPLVLGLLGAVAAAWGINRRLAEYR